MRSSSQQSHIRRKSEEKIVPNHAAALASKPKLEEPGKAPLQKDKGHRQQPQISLSSRLRQSFTRPLHENQRRFSVDALSLAIARTETESDHRKQRSSL
jgi:hypothetical protein